MQKFIIVIPVYNAVEYIRKCLLTVFMQDYKNYEAIVIDDCSTDGTWEIINSLPVKSFRNKDRVGSGIANIIRGIKLMNTEPEDVIVTLDGDDRFADRFVLSYLSAVYESDVWMTYGQYLPDSGKYKDFCKPVLNTREYRKSGKWTTSHLRTFKKWLWDNIKDEDLRNEEGEYFKVAWDRAFMYPLIEMSGKHCKFTDRILYLYNDKNPACDYKMLPKESEEVAQYIINKQEYKEL